MSRRFRDFVRLTPFTSAPASPGAGDLWYRSDTDQVLASDGVAGEPITVGPVGNLPVIATTRWHNLPAYGNAAAANVPNDRLFALPFWPGRTCTLTAVAVNVTTALAGSAVRMGLYASDGALPTDLVADYGTVATTLTGIRQISSLSTTVRPVLHFLVVGRQLGGLTLALSTRSSWEPIVSDTTPTIASNTNAYFKDGISGALPTTFGTPDGTDQGPCAAVQLT